LKAQYGPVDSDPCEEANGEGAKGVLPQRKDQGHPEGTGPRGKGRIRRAKEKIEAAGMTQDVKEKAMQGAEEARSHAAHVRRVHRVAQLSRLAAGGAVEEAVQGNSATSAARKKILNEDHYGPGED